MAQVVWSAATAHTGAMMRQPKGDPQDLAQAQRVFEAFVRLGERLRDARPDVVVIIATDHFLTFDYANLPIFAVGTGVSFAGHGEFGVPKRDYSGVKGLGEVVHQHVVAAGFDAVSARDMPVDHSFSCPLQLLLDGWDAPILPIYVNCTVEPLPSLERCVAFGAALGEALRAQGLAERVAIIGTGGLSHWVGLPQTGQINTDFDQRFLDLFTKGAWARIAAWNSDEVIHSAGNGAAEIRNWLVAAAASGAARAEVLAYEPVKAWVTGIGVTELRS